MTTTPAAAARAGARPAIPPARYADRLSQAQRGIADRGAAALLIGVGADQRYLAGYAMHLSERLTMLVVPSTGRPFLVVPRLEAMRAATAPALATGLVDTVAWDETDDPASLVASELEARGGSDRREVLVSGDLWAMHVLGLQRAMPERSFGLASVILRDLRMAKDSEEIELLRLAAEAADRAMVAIASGPLIGRTEADVSREIRERLMAEGHDEAGFAIVASGPDGASPHHQVSDRRLRPGEAVVLDIGGSLGGYQSDTTRTIWIEGPDGSQPPSDEFRTVHGLVQAANEAATAAVRPGAACEGLDAIARRVITDGGFGPEFLHRTGHGIGLEGHEEPYIVADSADDLRPGVSFSIEPGIYLAGRFGVRIEDIVVCGSDGPIALNNTRRDVWVVPG
jgi:Xaa-Pro aminopeptidase